MVVIWSFVFTPPVAEISSVAPADGLVLVEQSGMSVTLAGPPMDRGDYATVTFTTSAGGEFVISLDSFDVFTTPDADKEAANVSLARLAVNRPLPTLTASAPDPVKPGGSATAMVTADGFVGPVTFDGAEADGSVTASAPGEVTVTATDGIDPHAPSVTINFVWGELTLTASDPDPVKPGGSSSSMLTVEGQAEGAAVVITSSNDAVTISDDGTMASASGPATATLTATVGDAPPATADVAFVWGELTLTASDPDPVKPGGSSSSMLTVEGQADGATVVITSSNDAVTISDDGTMASASGPATATLTATVGDAPPATADVAFVWGELTLTASDPDPVKPGGSSSSMLTVEGQADGATVVITSSNDAVTISDDGTMASASGPATATLTATVGDAPPATADVAFVWGELTLEGPAEVIIGPDGGSAMLTVTGQADGVDAVITQDADAVDIDGYTISALVAATATLTASVGDVMSNSIEVSFVPSLVTDMTEVTIPRDGSAMATATAHGFPADADVNFVVTAGTDVVSSDDGSMLTLTKSTPGEVTAYATDGTNSTAPLTIAFVPTPPELVSDAADDMAEIPVGGSAKVVITALDFGDGISYTTEVTEGVATVDTKRDGANLELTVSGTGSATVAVTANDGTNTDTIEIKFTAGSLALEAGKSEVMVPVDGTGSTTVTVSGQANDDDVVFTDADGNELGTGSTLTLTRDGAATVTVTATVNGVSSEPITVVFTDGQLALVIDNEEVTVAPGGTGMATASLMNLAEGDEASFTVETTEGVTAEEGDTAVTLSSSGEGSATVTAMVNGLTTGSVSVAFALGDLTVALAEGSEAAKYRASRWQCICVGDGEWSSRRRRGRVCP